MDGLKIDRWRKSFEVEVKQLGEVYDAFLLPQKFEDTYKLKTNETGTMLSLWIDKKVLPKEIEKQLEELLLKTEPEDSV